MSKNNGKETTTIQAPKVGEVSSFSDWVLLAAIKQLAGDNDTENPLTGPLKIGFQIEGVDIDFRQIMEQAQTVIAENVEKASKKMAMGLLRNAYGSLSNGIKDLEGAIDTIFSAVDKMHPVEKTDNTAVEDNRRFQRCPSCSGHGYVTQQRGRVFVEVVCPRCNGASVIAQETCSRNNTTNGFSKSNETCTGFKS